VSSSSGVVSTSSSSSGSGDESSSNNSSSSSSRSPSLRYQPACLTRTAAMGVPSSLLTTMA